ncbi:MAG TPA: hypothetical protein VH540_17975 [Ktedonobacterales bacterium]
MPDPYLGSREYADAGVTWWLENLTPQCFQGKWSDWPLEQIHRPRQGPPKS